MRDLIIHQGDAVVATHGRGFWILDDVEPLRELASPSTRSARSGQAAYLFAPERAYRVRRSTNTDTPLPPEEPRGENPPSGAIIDYALASPAQRVTIAIYDRNGQEVRRYASSDALPAPIPHLDKPAYWEVPFVRPSTSAGMHRFVWDLREAPPRAFAQDLPISAVPRRTPRIPEGVLVVPGRYTVRLEVDGRTSQQPLEVVMDPRVAMSRQSLEEQYRLSAQLAAMMNRSYGRGNHDVNEEAAALLDTIDGADAPPTRQAAEAVAKLAAANNTGPATSEP
ncbi:MAG: hypothetical protein JO146_03405 [Candidatus Eremiobacteraeota bacterium]|nr:hypothetical protein [Candidatus Eremiobacteraeota bacterium]